MLEQHVNSHSPMACIQVQIADAYIDLQLISHAQINSPSSPLLSDLHCFLLCRTRSATPNSTTDRMSALKTHAPTTGETIVERESCCDGSLLTSSCIVSGVSSIIRGISSSEKTLPSAIVHAWDGTREYKVKVPMPTVLIAPKLIRTHSLQYS